MFPPLQRDKLHLKAWSWLKGLKTRVIWVECDHVQYEQNIGTTEGIHLLNL